MAGRHVDQGRRRIVIDNKTGDLGASGGVTTTTVLEQVDKDKKKERVRSIATAEGLQVRGRRCAALTYTGDAHMSGPQGDMTAAKIELYLKPSGDELERAEAYDERDAARAEPQDDRRRG